LLNSGTRPPVPTIVAYTDDHKKVFGAEPATQIMKERSNDRRPRAPAAEGTRACFSAPWIELGLRFISLWATAATAATAATDFPRW
jgi:hypothetical protein